MQFSLKLKQFVQYMYHFYLYNELKSRRIQLIVVIRFDIFRHRIPIFLSWLFWTGSLRSFCSFFVYQFFLYVYFTIYSRALKLRLETKETKVSPKNSLVKSSGNNSIFLPVFNLIICVMKASNNFGKIAILKIWELISLGVVKTHFGKLALKWCIFRHEKINILTDIMSLLLIQSRFRHT